MTESKQALISVKFSASNSQIQTVRVLVVAQDAGTVSSLTAEMMQRSALVAVATNVAEAGAAVRATTFEVIFVCAREADAETALIIQLLRGASLGTPRVMFLAEPDHVADHPMAVSAADATVSWTLPPDEIADLAVPRKHSAKKDIAAETVEIQSETAIPAEVSKLGAEEAPAPRTSDITAAEHAESTVLLSEAQAAMAEASSRHDHASLIPAANTIARAAEAIARAAESIASRNYAPAAHNEPKVQRAEAPAVAIAEPVVARAEPSILEPVAITAPPPEVAHVHFDREPVEAVALAPLPAPIEVVTTIEPEIVAKVPEIPAAPSNPLPVAPARPEPVAVPEPRKIEAKAAEPAKPVTPPVAPGPLLPLPHKPQLATVARLPNRPDRQLAPSPDTDVVATPGTDPNAAPAQANRRFYDKAAAAPTGSRWSKIFYATGWFGLAAMIIGLTSWPISTQAQFTLGAAVVGVMTLIRKLRLGGIWRPIFLTLGMTMILRYVYWRSTSTLPPLHDWVNFTPGFILYLAEMYCVLMFFISMFIVADPIERKPPPQLPEDRLPTVDVYIPTYNEGSDLLAATIAAASQMDYPKDRFNIFLLDDGGTDQKCNQSDPEKAGEAIARRAELQSLALELGITYITRVRNEHAKAGNMNNALQQTGGELIVVFDADHAPARQFLRETVGYFSLDRRLFLVQTPHFFLNPDPVEKNLQTFDRMPSENEMFYGTIQKGLDKWNGAFFCGSAAVISRRALESVGGFSGISITEDCETALDLHTRGWNSLYVDKPLIAGLQPESLVSFIGQRSRWCRGMIQILVLKNPLLTRNISLKQRICYVSSMFYWLFPIPRMIFLVSPFLYIFFSMQIFVANAQEFFAYVTIYMLTHMTIQNYLYGSTRWPWISEAYEYVQTLYLVLGIWGVLVNPRKPTFNVTAKGLTLDNDHLSEMALPYFISFGAILASLVVACWRFLADNEVNELLLIVGGWSFYNLIIAGVALGIVAERRERRKTPRLKISRKGELTYNGTTVQVEVKDASIGGMRILPLQGRLPAEFTRGIECELLIKPDRPNFVTEAIPCTLRNVTNDGSGAVYGLQFNTLHPQHYRGIADAMYSDMATFENFRASRRKIKGITMGTLQFFWWSVNHTARAFYYAIALRKPKAEADPEEAATKMSAAFAANAAPVIDMAAQPIAEQAILARPIPVPH